MNLKIHKQRLYVLLAFVLFLSLVVFSAPSSAAELYENVLIDSTGQLHIVTTDKKDILPSKREFQLGGETLKQVGFSKAVISDDKTTVGWLAEYPNCCTSYPIPLELVIYRNAKVLRVFSGNELPVWRWVFEKNGTQVAFEQETVHGGLGVHFELREIKSGLLVEKHDDDPTPDAPAWIRDLTPKKLIPPDGE